MTPAYLSHKFVKQILSGGRLQLGKSVENFARSEAIQEPSDCEDAEVVIRGCLGPIRLLEYPGTRTVNHQESGTRAMKNQVTPWLDTSKNQVQGLWRVTSRRYQEFRGLDSGLQTLINFCIWFLIELNLTV